MKKGKLKKVRRPKYEPVPEVMATVDHQIHTKQELSQFAKKIDLERLNPVLNNPHFQDINLLPDSDNREPNLPS